MGPSRRTAIDRDGTLRQTRPMMAWRTSRMAVVVRPLLIVVVVLALLVAALWLFQRKLIYLPDASPPPPASQSVAGARDVVLETADGLRLGAWLVPPPAATTGAEGGRPDRRMVVLAAPGNGGNRAGRVEFARALAAEGFTVLLLEYRGYGGNPGASDRGRAGRRRRGPRERFWPARGGPRTASCTTARASAAE